MSDEQAEHEEHDDDQTADGDEELVGPNGESAEEIEEERKKRLDPETRADTAEVDNTDRTFDTEKGLFTDSDDYDETPVRFPEGGEAPEDSDDSDSDDSGAEDSASGDPASDDSGAEDSAPRHSAADEASEGGREAVGASAYKGDNPEDGEVTDGDR